MSTIQLKTNTYRHSFFSSRSIINLITGRRTGFVVRAHISINRDRTPAHTHTFRFVRIYLTSSKYGFRSWPMDGIPLEWTNRQVAS